MLSGVCLYLESPAWLDRSLADIALINGEFLYARWRDGAAYHRTDLLSLVTHSYVGVLLILILWSFAAWSTGPTQQYHLATLEPELSGVLLGINQSMMQFAMAAGAGIGGIL
ncbi:hypothetical protein PO124_30610 [Bacillus licheniformis]|nr:hypothetical protein [Bacillus licheniformis]